MTNTLPPAAIFILGAFLIPMLRGRVKSGYLLLLPLIAFWNLLNLPLGPSWQTGFLDYTLIFCRVDRLSLVFGYIFVLITLIGIIYALHIKDDGQHMAAEFIGRFKKERKALPAIALSTNTSSLTALANDYGYAVSFKRQIEGLGKKGDIAIGISTSGGSQNVIRAMEAACKLGLKTIALSGGSGGPLKNAADIAIVVNSKNTPRVQEAHIMIIHIICEIIEDAL